MNKILKLIVFSAILSSAPLMSFPYKMYTGMTGEMTLGVTGYLETRDLFKKNVGIESPIYLNYGILRNFDIFAGILPVSYLPKTGIGAGHHQFSIMPRFQFTEGVIGAVEFLIPGSKTQHFGLNPQFHYLGGLGDFLVGFINAEARMFFGNSLGVLESIRAKGALGFYPGSFLGFSLFGVYAEYHIAYDFYKKYISYLDHLGVGIYMAFDNDATFGISISPYVNQSSEKNFGFGLGAWIYYAYDFKKLANK